MAERIRTASLLAKVAFNRKSRDAAYKLKTDLLQQAILAFPTMFEPLSFEHVESIGILILFKVPGGSIHVPLSSLTICRASVDLNELKYKCTTRRRIFRQPFSQSTRPAFSYGEQL